jgi:sugar (pentulose or hexulose) kinase
VLVAVRQRRVTGYRKDMNKASKGFLSLLLLLLLLMSGGGAGALALVPPPTEPRYFAGVDLGTSGCRLSIVVQQQDTDLKEVYESSMLWKDGQHDDPAAWVAAVRTLLQQAAPALPWQTSLQALCVSGTSASCLLCDSTTGRVTRAPRMYNYSVLSKASDEEDDAMVAAAQTALAELVRAAPPQHTATSPTSSLAKLLAWHAQSPLTETEVLVHQADYVAAHLRGSYTHVDGSSVPSDWHNCLKLGFDVRGLAWPTWLQDLLTTVGVDAAKVLPSSVVSPGQIVGMIDPQVATALGLSLDTQVVAGTTDSNAAFLAAATLATRGTAVTSLGSTTALKLVSDTYVEDATYGVYSHRFPQVLQDHTPLGATPVSDSFTDATWLVGGASNAGCAVFRQLGFTNEQLDAWSAQIDPTQTSPHVYYPLTAPGERFPVADPNKLPVLEPRPDSHSEYLHGLLEGLTGVEVEGYAKLHELGAPWPSHVATCGGGARNDAWMAMRQNRLSRRATRPIPVERAAGQVEASFGAARLAAASFLYPSSSSTVTTAAEESLRIDS